MTAGWSTTVGRSAQIGEGRSGGGDDEYDVCETEVQEIDGGKGALAEKVLGGDGRGVDGKL